VGPVAGPDGVAPLRALILHQKPEDVDESIQNVGELVVTPQVGQAEENLVPPRVSS